MFNFITPYCTFPLKLVRSCQLYDDLGSSETCKLAIKSVGGKIHKNSVLIVIYRFTDMF